MTDRYAVIGNPVAHSRSPAIHALFAKQTGHDIEYGRLLAPLDGFVEAVERFRDAGGRGLNVTLPFKLDAFVWAGRRSARALAAGAVNTLRFDGPREAFGDNTDGIGLVRDIESRHGLRLAGCSIAILGAGGASRGAIGPLLEAGAARITIANRTPARALELAAAFAAAPGRVQASTFESLDPGYDLIVNATSAGLAGERLPIADAVLAAAKLAYDMFYGARDTAFVAQARAAGCPRACDGLGMLIEQAAESFLVWRGVRPLTAPVHEAMRSEIAAESG